MEIKETILYAYPDQALRDFWGKWSDTIFFEKQPINSTFQEIAGSTNSNDRSRADDLYNVGVLKGVLVTPQELGKAKPFGWTLLQQNQSVHTNLGYLAYLIGKTQAIESINIEHGFSALCAIFSIQLGIQYADNQLSYVSIFDYLTRSFPQPDGVKTTVWRRYLAAGMFSTIQSYAAETTIENLINNHPIDRLIFRWKNGEEIDTDYNAFCSLISRRQSVATLLKAKHNLFFIGSETDERGVYSQASKHNQSFLSFYAQAEIQQVQQGLRRRDCFNYPFLLKNPLVETPDIIQELLKLTHLSPDWQRTVTHLMKTLQTGCIEAVSMLYGQDAVSQIQSVSKITEVPDQPLPNSPKNRILFGPPGTGKSSKIKSKYANPDTYPNLQKYRVTFHPDYEYGSFVGSYKPISVEVNKKKEIQYEYVPQEFTYAYTRAWNDPGRAHFLIIEEINRGNCAQIFGDIFQSLDRDANGFSEYEVDTDTDLAAHLTMFFKANPVAAKRLGDQLTKHRCPADAYSKIILPDNLYIYATMNTSDQSLFPMDSAFKRRWDWEYIPINYKPLDEKGNRIDFKIVLNSNNSYSWSEFIKIVNGKISEVTHSEDKQIGFWFIKPSADFKITEEEFTSKVLFYLWFDVFRNYPDESIFPATIKRNGIQTDERFGYGHLFDISLKNDLLTGIMNLLNVRDLGLEPLPNP